jgi:Ankyrin repeats (many copies)
MLIKMTHQGVNTRDAYGQAPLHLAALRGNLDAVEYLVLEAKVSSHSYYASFVCIYSPVHILQ